MHRTSRATPAARGYRVAPPGRLPLLGLWLPLLLAAGLVAAVGLSSPDRGHRLHWATLVLLPATGTVLSLLYLRRGIRLDGPTLLVRSSLFTSRTDLAAMDLAHARVVDLAEHGEFAPTRKTIGYGLPGFKSGHFRMRNGARAFCLLTDASRVLALPLRDGRWLLLSPEQPRQLLQDLQRLAAHRT
ncbi:PH domain-containing protein [Xanthomonas bundabergensis]|uniref:PH domain-containing protein n=1 Tax=Xanthomonas bundabergensis TaxID=3160842 RepID=UPI003518326F